jgi:putative flippase GtrA
MKVSSNQMNNIKAKEIRRFLVAGFSAVGVDLTVYYLLLNILSHSPAKAISFISGTVVAFILNKFWTFDQYQKSLSELAKFIVLYSCTLAANVMVNNLSLLLMPKWLLFAFLAATGTSTVLNFIGMKWWVFRKDINVE